ncbi:MAG: hypothetical protein NVSMB1_17620 [Polyangiales bacterium]
MHRDLNAGPSREEPTEVEIVTLPGDPEYDRQRFAVGLEAGPAYFMTSGSRGEPAADFSIVGEYGLGPYGARVPWTAEIFASFAVMRTSLITLSEQGKHPNRFTAGGARIIYRGTRGWLDGRWISVGAGVVLTSWDRPDSLTPAMRAVCSSTSSEDAAARNALGPSGCALPDTSLFGGLVDVGVGIQEWTSRFARYGIGARVPIELSAHPGIGAVAFFYAQLGLGG